MLPDKEEPAVSIPVSQLFQEIKNDIKEVVRQQTEITREVFGRITALEAFKNRVIGIALAGGAVSGVITGLAVGLLLHFLLK